MRGNGRAARKDGAAEIERIARVSVRPRDGEDLLLAEMTGGQRAKQQASKANDRAEQDAARRGTSEPENADGERIAEADAIARQKGGGVHAQVPIWRRTASKTCSTEISSIEGSYWSRRL